MTRVLMALLIVMPIVIGLGGERRADQGALLADPCLHGITVEESAERIGGGADYRVGEERYCKTPLISSHSDHNARYGGSFFMAPNGIHHVEFVYSDQCGAQVVLYNSFTQEVHAARQLLGMVRVIPDSEEEPETMRFLRPSADDILLGADIGPIQKPFELEFNLQFPYRIEPDLFNLYVAE